MTEDSTPVFEARGLTFRYNQSRALESVNVSIRPGCRVGLLGANGSGKSTLLRLLDGLCFPDEGSIEFCGEPLTSERMQDAAFALSFHRRVGLLFQNPDVQLFCPTVFDEVAFGPLQLRWPKSEIRRRVLDMLETIEIAHLKDRSPHHLSMGEKKRVALASVLVVDPEILLLDEPTAMLDPKSASHMISFLIGWKGGPKTVITATHDLDHIEDIADQCYVLQEGRVLAEGAPGSILSDTPLLERTSLLHCHRHVHPSAPAHTHAHSHPHEH
ncbi:MAG: ABC transporter ATP-binding protein [Acidobacteriota bacterium]|nr:ABC transporter ATP-binding protein [Acidobacteriota bacterium]